MLTPRLTTCSQNPEILSLIDDIDCAISKLSYNLYINTVYMLNAVEKDNVISYLLHYKRILIYKNVSLTYAENWTVDMIISKIKRYIIGCVNPCLSNSIIDNIGLCCDLTSTTTTILPIYPTTTTTTTIVLDCELPGGTFTIITTTTTTAIPITTTTTTLPTTTTTTTIPTTTTTTTIALDCALIAGTIIYVE